MGTGLEANDVRNRLIAGDDPVHIATKSDIDFGAGALLPVSASWTLLGSASFLGQAPELVGELTNLDRHRR